jgi:Mn-dependent DtxR family transcriptional regulator
MIGRRVFECTGALGRAQLAALCEELPFDRRSISGALQRLCDKGLVSQEKGYYWAVAGSEPPIDRRGGKRSGAQP